MAPGIPFAAPVGAAGRLIVAAASIPVRGLMWLPRQLGSIASSTDGMERQVTRVASATAHLPSVDRQLVDIAATMPALLTVERSLEGLPETMERLDDMLGRLETRLDTLILSLDLLGETTGTLSESIQPLGRVADRFGRSRGKRNGMAEADSAPAQSQPPARRAANE